MPHRQFGISRRESRGRGGVLDNISVLLFVFSVVVGIAITIAVYEKYPHMQGTKGLMVAAIAAFVFGALLRLRKFF